jgi:hypothetical protein
MATFGVTQDFYGDATGLSLTTMSNGGGLSLGRWLLNNGGGSTAYVQVWYDQIQYVNGGGVYNAVAITDQ